MHGCRRVGIHRTVEAETILAVGLDAKFFVHD
jgi:hypothetical protein